MSFKDLEKEQAQRDKKIEQEVNEVLSSIAESIVQEEILTSQATIKKDRKRLIEKELHIVFNKFQDQITNGFQQLIATLKELSKNRPELFNEQVIKAIVGFGVLQYASHDDYEKIKYALQKGIFLDKICSISEYTLEAFYQAGKSLYERQQWEQASSVFIILTIINPGHSLFWLALGNSEFFRAHYETAKIAYAMAAVCDPFDPFCHLYSSKCCEMLGEFELAENALELAQIAINDSREHKELKSEIIQEQRRLQQKIRG
jgi:tetratricopeptide (TPR) repeat protein